MKTAPANRRGGVIVADPEPCSRSGIVHLLSKHERIKVVGESAAIAPLHDLCHRLHPEVLVFDAAMGDGATFIRDVAVWSPTTKVVVFTLSTNANYVQRVLQAGAWGFVDKRDPMDALVTSVLSAMDGARYVGPRVERAILDWIALGCLEPERTVEKALSDREFQVFRLLGNGLKAREVADELKISVKTVETHKHRIREKLGIQNGAKLQQQAFRHQAGLNLLSPL